MRKLHAWDLGIWKPSHRGSISLCLRYPKSRSLWHIIFSPAGTPLPPCALHGQAPEIRHAQQPHCPRQKSQNSGPSWPIHPVPALKSPSTIPPSALTKSICTRNDFRGGSGKMVAMARAFMRIREAELLILDEPSSALDPQAESCSRL